MLGARFLNGAWRRPARLGFVARLAFASIAVGALLAALPAAASAQTSSEKPSPEKPSPEKPSLGPRAAPEAPSGPARPSACYAFSENREPAPPVQLARFVEGLQKRQAGITFIGHATFLIESPEGVTVATDYAGYAGPQVVPSAVTMNGAHTMHFTSNPDPRIENVFRGWRADGAPADHYAKLEDMLIRSVSTDTVTYSGMRANGNSIFVFEIDDLCIGHLGHLHHVPTREQLAQVGFLDVVMAPVDGGYTLPLADMITTIDALRARVVIPMHAFGSFTLERFLSEIASSYPVVRHESATFVASKTDLPKTTTVIVLPALRPDTDY